MKKCDFTRSHRTIIALLSDNNRTIRVISVALRLSEREKQVTQVVYLELDVPEKHNLE